MWMVLTHKTNLFAQGNKRMLHIAPEWAFEAKIKQIPGLTYVTADLMKTSVVERMDVTRIPHLDDTFDAIICSHVLEHVPDDRGAIRELHRVLAPDGWAILQVPISADPTFEDPSITSPEERERRFGQYDHVRRYGPDYMDRLRNAGFTVQCITPASFLNSEQIRSMNLIEDYEIVLCGKD